ncbi:hypothetical protein AB3S75_003849 [Citrus x aurantiifolia]
MLWRGYLSNSTKDLEIQS